MAPLLTQLRTVLWRNILVKRRGWKRTTLETLAPVLLVAVMALIRLGVHTHEYTHQTSRLPPHDISTPMFAPPHSITASPALRVTADIMDHVIEVLNVTSLGYQLHDDVLSEQAELSYLDNRNMTDVGVGFLLGNSSGKVLVEGYVIRMPHEDHHYVTSDCSFRNSMETCARSTDGLTTECPGSQPLLSGLLRLQWAVETVLTQKFWDPGFKPPALQVQMMPMPFYKPGVTNMQLLVALSMVIALTPLAYCVTATMVTEKKKWAKVMLKILGVSDSVFWISWWLTYLVVVVVAGGLAAVLVAASGVLDGPGVGYFYLLLLLYGASLLGLGSVVAVFFKTPKLAGCACSVLSILLGMLHMCVSLTRPSKWSSSTNSGDPMTQSSVPFGGQLVFSFLSPTAFALGIDRLVFDNEENVRTAILSGQFPLLAVVLMLILDCGMYGLLAVYLDTVVSDHDRLTQTACFFLKPSFWRPRRDDDVRDAPPHDTPEGPHLEPLPESLDDRRVIRIRDLSKSFSSGGKERMHGLDGLDLDIVEGQVTCILGHSGSGKTTLMKILAGVTAPSRGAAFIGNFNVSCIGDQKELTSVVTFCPQCDFVLGDLTVEEHMHISGRLRGVPSDSLQHEIGSILDTFHLDKDRGTMVWKLTGCQRRRLSLAMAFLVDTKVILLDEPTLGLEADERRHLLRLLHSKKEGRVIVFTSRHMDEADYYSDRKIVISQGHLRCVGSSDFLKQYFNVGYRLNLEVHEATNTERLMRVVRSHVRDANLLHRRDNYLTVAVPLLQAGKLTVLLRQLESNERGAEYLGVARFGITLTTLEQLFWKLGEEEAAGCVFISPHLMLAQEPTFIGEDLSTPGSMHPSRRWTGSISHDDQSSATAFLQRRHTESSMSQHGKPGARNRALSTFLTRFANPRGSDVSHHSPCSGRPAESSSRHSKSSRSKSLAMIIPTRKGSSAGHAPHDLEYRPGFDGNNYGNIERRRTVATFQDARSLAQQNLIGMPPDPMAKLRALDSYEQVQKAALADTAEETAESSDAGPDPENAPPPPLKMGEVLAGLQAPKKGVCLDLQRLAAMLRLRVLIRVSEKWWVLLRVVLTVLLTVAALGTSHALLPEAEWSSRQKERLPLFGRHPLFYTNSSGDPVDSLLANLSRSGHELVHVSDLEALDYPSNMQSILDIMESNGSVYRLHYNASCAMALPQLISTLAGVDRNYSDAAPTTPNSNSSIGLAPTVSAWLQPWPTVTRHENRGVLDWVPVLFLGLALVVSVSTFAVTLISERKKRLRRYVDVIGVTRWMYYGTAVTIDVLEFALPATFLVILCAVSKMAIFEAEGSVYSLAVLVVLYMGAGVLWMYALSFLCRQAATWLFCLMPVLVLVTLGSFFLMVFMDSDTEKSATVLHYVLTVVWTPYIPFGALHYMTKVGIKEKLKHDDVLYVFRFDSNIDICFIMLSVDIVVLWIVVLILDKLVSRPPTLPCTCKKRNNRPDSAPSCRQDDSVRKEMERVQDLHKGRDKEKWPRLMVDEASKVFGGKRRELRAVDQVTFGVDQGEVLGLLGPRDAGKSSLLDMMLGLSPLSAGSIHMDSQSREAMTPRESGGKIGYCPHYNPLWEGLTVDQHVHFVGHVKGLTKHDQQGFRHSLYHDLDLRHCRSQKIRELSEGDRRKLSFAMSMIGAQTFMMVDEPSAGMDVRSRHLFWDAVNYFLKSSQRSTVVLTQCPKEAQRLCTRLAVMVNGQLKCLGTQEELRSLCEETYRLEVTLGRWDELEGPRRMDMLTLFLEELFPGLQRLEHFGHRVLFGIHNPGSLLALSTTMDNLESLKRNLDLRDFTFSQTDIEQLFLHYARDQKEGESRFSPVLSTTTRHDAPGTTESAPTPSHLPTAPPDSCRPHPSSGPVAVDVVESGTSSEAAVGEIIVHCEQDSGGAEEGRQRNEKEEEEEIGKAGSSAAAPTVFRLEGVDNRAFTSGCDESWEDQTYL